MNMLSIICSTLALHTVVYGASRKDPYAQWPVVGKGILNTTFHVYDPDKRSAQIDVRASATLSKDAQLKLIIAAYNTMHQGCPAQQALKKILRRHKSVKRIEFEILDDQQSLAKISCWREQGHRTIKVQSELTSQSVART